MPEKSNLIAGYLAIEDYESISVTDSVKSLTSARYTKLNRLAKRVLITVEDGQIRWRADGTNPSATEGHLLNPMDSLVLMHTSNIKNFRCIRKTTTSGTIKVSYEF